MTRHHRVLVGVFAMCVVATIVAQTARPMTITDLLAAVRVTGPQLAPDGSRVAYVRTTTDLTSGKRNGDIWQVPTGGGPAKALVTGDKSETTPRWAPDGRHLFFISTRDGDPQVYVADADGANVRRITNVSGGAQAPLVVSPDGTKIAFVADVHPACTSDDCNKAEREKREKDPVKVHHLTRLLFRHWDEWREDVRHHVLVADAMGGSVRDVTPGDFDSPPTQQEDNAIAFSPDGRTLAFVSNRDGNDREAWTTNNDVWLVPVAGSGANDARKLTPNPAADVQPVFTRDGRSLIVRAQRRPGFESDRWYLDVYDRETGAKRTVFDTPDLSVNDFVLSRDGRDIFFTATSQGSDNIYRVPLAGGAPRLVAKGGSFSALNAGDAFLVASQSSMRSPADVFRVALEGGSPQPLTRENDGWLKQVAFAAPESLSAPGAGGAPVQYWLIKPPAFDASKKYPAVFLIHGGPQGAWDDAWSSRWNPELWAAQGWVVVAPNPRGSFGFGQAFVDDISRDWGGKVMQDLDAVFDAAAKLPYVDASRLGIAGASYGGYAVNWIIGHSTRFKAAVSHDGVFNLESMSLATEELWFSEWEAGGPATSESAREVFGRWSPHRFAANIRTPTLVITNELDYRVPVDQGLQLFTALRRNGVPAEALVFPDEGHWVLKPLNSQRWHETVFGWMKRWLK